MKKNLFIPSFPFCLVFWISPWYSSLIGLRLFLFTVSSSSQWQVSLLDQSMTSLWVSRGSKVGIWMADRASASNLELLRKFEDNIILSGTIAVELQWCNSSFDLFLKCCWAHRRIPWHLRLKPWERKWYNATWYQDDAVAGLEIKYWRNSKCYKGR